MVAWVGTWYVPYWSAPVALPDHRALFVGHRNRLRRLGQHSIAAEDVASGEESGDDDDDEEESSDSGPHTKRADKVGYFDGYDNLSTDDSDDERDP